VTKRENVWWVGRRIDREARMETRYIYSSSVALAYALRIIKVGSPYQIVEASHVVYGGSVFGNCTERGKRIRGVS
jgi:hypothetical protein